MEARKAENSDTENVNQNFLQSPLLQCNRNDFLEDLEVRLIDKAEGSDPTRREYYWMRTQMV